MRIYFGVVAGMVVAFLCIWLIQSVGHSIFPLPAAIEPGNVAGEAAAAPEAAPVLATSVILIAWVVGAVLGAWAACRVAQRALPGWIVALLIVIAGIANMLTAPNPWWMWAGGILLPLAGAAIVQRLTKAPL